MKQTVSSYIGDERFAYDGHRYLRYLTANTQNYNKLILELDKLKETSTWEQCEFLFIKVTMDQQQRINELLNLLSLGMKADETYAQFSHRVGRDACIYGISENNEIIIAQLLEVMPKVVTDKFFVPGSKQATFLERFVQGHEHLPLTSGSFAGLPRVWLRKQRDRDDAHPSLLFLNLPDSSSSREPSKGLASDANLDLIQRCGPGNVPNFGR